jgi:death-on-curing protein
MRCRRNKRLALRGLIAFLGANGCRLTLTNDEAYDLVISTCELSDGPDVAGRIRAATDGLHP